MSAREVKLTEGLLPGGRDVAFAEIEATLASLVRDGRSKRGPARAATATVIVVGTPDRLADAAEALKQLGESGVVRAILISEGDQTSPVVTSVSASPAALWPPNKNMVPVVVTVSASDAVSTPVSRIVSIAGNDGATAADWQITGALTAQVRADRSGGGSGRTYVLTVETVDAAGNTTRKTVNVVVPHDQGK